MNGMFHRPVMRKIQYDDKKGMLVVELSPGGTYQYFDVPAEVYQDMMTSPSRDDYFDSRLRHKYRHRRILGV